MIHWLLRGHRRDPFTYAGRLLCRICDVGTPRGTVIVPLGG